MSHTDPRIRAVIRARHFAEKSAEQLRRHAEGVGAGDIARQLEDAIQRMRAIERSHR